MAKQISKGYTDSPISGVSELKFDRGLLNYKADFRVKSEDAGKEIILTNITSPIDRPEKIRIAYSDVANIYNGSGIESGVYAPTKRGVSVLAQVTNVISVTDDTDPTYRVDLPVSYHLVIKVPVSEAITGQVIQEGIGRLLSGLYDTGSTSISRLDSILRGSLTPSDM